MIEKREEIKNYNIWQPFLLSVMMIMGMVLGYKMNDADNPPLIQASRLMLQKSNEFHLEAKAFHSSSDKLKFAK